MDGNSYEERMAELTRRFYAEVGPSFSDTRQRSWQGWERFVDTLGLGGKDTLSVLDIACGNLRFERYLETLVGKVCGLCVDADAGLVARGRVCGDLSLIICDVISQLISGTFSGTLSEAGLFDIAVSFGFMHHVPSQALRIALARTMLEHVRVGGHLILSFWQFSHDERIMRKARPADGGFEGDYLLGWQDRDDVCRFCHDTSENQIDELVGALGASSRVIARYSADGKRGDLNRYLILERTGD